MRVTKMHGLGNDYVYVNGFEETIENAPELARRVSDRHFGVGGDGLIIVQPPTSSDADCRMEMYNADGSRAQMCGNGIRCVAKFARDRDIASGSRVRVESDAGLHLIDVLGREKGGVSMVRVGMGEPTLRQSALPARMPGLEADARVIDEPLDVPGVGRALVTLVSTGNPHCVLRVDDERQPDALRVPVRELPLGRIGRLFESHEVFPERVNTEFVAVRGRDEIDFRVWERGSGETLACGTGACAAVVAGASGGWLDRAVTVHLLGGDLRIDWDEGTNEILMTGPATEVFTAEIVRDWLSGV